MKRFNKSGSRVGHIGKNGFWALGASELAATGDARTMIKTYEGSGNLISERVIHD